MPEVNDLVRRSRFIFKGTIQKLNAATMSVVPVTDSTAIVKVEQVFQAPETLGDYTDQDITVQLGDPKGAKEGQQAVFFANSWLYGESIAVVEVGRVAPEDLTQLRQQIADAKQSIADEELQGRIASADVVVVGQVSSIRPVEPGEHLRARMSEHEPQWGEAVVSVEAVEKGELKQDPLMFLFSTSIDVQWHKAPKFHADQEGIWILHTGQVEELGAEVYVVTDPLDFHPREQLDRIKGLIEGTK